LAAIYPADTFQEGVDLTIEASNQLAQVVRGDANTEVMVADGSTIPSIRKAQADSMYFKEPELWTTGQTETDYLQLKKYIDPTTNKESWWFAKSATVLNPVVMGTSPFGDDNWTLYTPEDLFISGKAEYESIYQALKGKAAEAGYNLVRGSFEEGGTLTGTSDVLWYQANGKYYNWFDGSAKTVVAGSTPAGTGGIGAGAWVDRTDLTLRSELLGGGASMSEIASLPVEVKTRNFMNDARNYGFSSVSADNSSALNKFIASSDTDLIIYESYKIASTVTIPSTKRLYFFRNAQLISTSGTLTVNAKVYATSIPIKADGGNALVNAIAISVGPSGDFTTIQGALDSVPDTQWQRFNITIAAGVTRVDAWLVAKNDSSRPGAYGAIATCDEQSGSSGANGVAQWLATPNGSGTNYTQSNNARLTIDHCRHQLRINGPVIANKLYLRRTAGSGPNTDAGTPAEIINLRPDAYLWAREHMSTGTVYQVTSEKELPPRY
jgi:hypothetical protein